MDVMGTMPEEKRALRRRIAELIAGEDDPDVRWHLAELLAFGEAEVDEEERYSVGTTTMELLDGAGVDHEEIGAGIRRYRIA